MGMAATQARLLSLQARMSNVEYQGQQINQERTILSQQATDLYTSLLGMTVPVPPSTQDYSTVTYSGVDGNTTITLGIVKPSGDLYNVEIQQTSTGAAIESNYGSSVVVKEPAVVTGNLVTEIPEEDILETNLPNYYIQIPQKDAQGNPVLDDNNNQKYTVIQLDKTQVGTYLVGSKKGSYKIVNPLPDDAKLFIGDAAGQEIGPNPRAGEYKIAGKQAYSFQEAETLFEDLFEWDKYREAIANTYGTQDSSTKPEDFYVFVDTSDTGTQSIKFALKSDVQSVDGFTAVSSYTPNGRYTKSTETDKCKLEFDAQGRIVSIGIPSYDKTTKEVLSYKNISLKAEKSYDEQAYQDAYSQYEYKMYEYDKKNQEINAKTKVIQVEDKNLELKLQRLDNERSALKTEIDACEKVINDNIEKSFKTFSG